MEHVDISVISVSAYDPSTLFTFFGHLEHQTYPAARFEVVLLCAPAAQHVIDLVNRFSEGSPVRIRVVQYDPDSTSAIDAAFKAAQGKWLLWLDHDLVASPNLLEAHVAAQENAGGDALMVGQLKRHPQCAPQTLTRFFLPEYHPVLQHDKKAHYLDCFYSNVSLPKNWLIPNNIPHSTYFMPGVAYLDFIWSLAQQGTEIQFEPAANLYFWHGTDFSSERQQYYRLGHQLHQLYRKTKDPAILTQFRLQRGKLKKLIDLAVSPFYLRACEQAEHDAVLMAQVYQRLFYHDLRCGYEDAATGRALPKPQYDAVPLDDTIDLL